MATILIIILVLMLLGAFPTWNHSRNWGYGGPIPCSEREDVTLGGVSLAALKQAEDGGPDEAFPADVCFQNPHFGFRGVLRHFKRSRYSLLETVRTGY